MKKKKKMVHDAYPRERDPPEAAKWELVSNFLNFEDERKLFF